MNKIFKKKKRKKKRNVECIADLFSEDSFYTPKWGVGGVGRRGGGKRRKAFP